MKEIPLTKGQFAIVDDEDFERLSKFKWHAKKCPKTYYAKRSVRKNGHSIDIAMPHDIMGVPCNVMVDHKDHNGLNNRRSNLRVCTRAENNRNASLRSTTTSGFKGVSRENSKWLARIRLNGVIQRLGTFKTPEEAARAYDAAARKLYGEFAHTNFNE